MSPSDISSPFPVPFKFPIALYCFWVNASPPGGAQVVHAWYKQQSQLCSYVTLSARIRTHVQCFNVKWNFVIFDSPLCFLEYFFSISLSSIVCPCDLCPSKSLALSFLFTIFYCLLHIPTLSLLFLTPPLHPFSDIFTQSQCIPTSTSFLAMCLTIPFHLTITPPSPYFVGRSLPGVFAVIEIHVI